MGVAGVALAAAPYLAKASALQQLTGAQKSGPVAAVAKPAAQQSTKPLVLIVKDDHVLGYRGLEEIPVHDISLASMLHGRFLAKEAT